MQKTIVTHYSPDFDAIPAIWLLKKFDPDCANAKVAFVPAGQTLNGQPADIDSSVIHVDTGGGRFDHHATNEHTCAAALVWQWLKRERGVEDEAIDRLMPIIIDYDHGKDVEWENACDDKYELMLPALIDGLKILYPGQYEKVVEYGMQMMDALHVVMRSKVEAEKILAQGLVFDTRWGKGIGVETSNEAVLQLGEKMGYSLVIKKDPKRKNIRIYGRSDRGVDFSGAYKLLKNLDSDANWFLHASKCLLLNGSAKNPNMKPTKLSLEEVIDVLKLA